MVRNSYAQYIHKFELTDGEIRYAVAEWFPDRGQYIRPLDKSESALTGCGAEFARSPRGVQYYADRRKALRRARYLFGELANGT